MSNQLMNMLKGLDIDVDNPQTTGTKNLVLLAQRLASNYPAERDQLQILSNATAYLSWCDGDVEDAAKMHRIYGLVWAASIIAARIEELTVGAAPGTGTMQ